MPFSNFEAFDSQSFSNDLVTYLLPSGKLVPPDTARMAVSKIPSCDKSSIPPSQSVVEQSPLLISKSENNDALQSETRVSLHSDVIEISLFAKDEWSLPADDIDVVLAFSQARSNASRPIPTPIFSWSIRVSSSITR
ncbi:hypothetical protein ACHAWC_007429 [Mediolabrus comicus]